MKQKKLKQWLTVALSLALLGLGLSIGINADKLNAKPSLKKTFSEKAMVGDPADWPKLGTGNGTFGNPVEDAEPWLPYYKPGLGIGGGGWLDSMTSYIPRSNAFTMQYLPEKTKVVDWSENIAPKNTPVEDLPKGRIYKSGNTFVQELDHTVAFPITKGEESFIEFSNIGYYNGENVGLKVTVIPTTQGNIPNEKRNSYIVIEDTQHESGYENKFLRVESAYGASPMVEYVLLGSNGKPLNMLQGEGAYFVNDMIGNVKYTDIQMSLIKNIYSIGLDSDEKSSIRIKYENDSNNDWLQLLGVLPIDESIQRTATVTFAGNRIMFGMRAVSGTTTTWSSSTMSIGYESQSLVKVEIPDPQATSQTYTEIIDADKGITDNQVIDPLNYGFIQQMPWESKAPKDNRTQIPTWTLGAPADNATVVPSDKWKVQSQDDPTLGGGDVYDWFTATDNSLIPKGGLAGKLAEDEFYNHYYKFNRSLNIDYNKPIARTLLKAKDGLDGYYFDYSGKVDLAVDDTNPTPEQEAGMNKNRGEVTYDTAINFLADDVQYKYLDQKIYEAQIAAGKSESEARAAAAINFGGLTWGTTPQPNGKGQAIVTWQVPLTPTTYTDANLADPGTPESETNKAPSIPGYEYVAGSAELNAQIADYQVKVTKFLADGKTEAEATAADYTKPNEVVLFYEPQGDVEIEDENEAGVTTYLADDIDFGNITVPTASTITKAPEANNGTDKDQYPSLVVKDTRLKNYREAGWTLYVTMTEPFRLKKGDGTFDDDQTIENILKYKNNFTFNQDGEEIAPTELAITKGDKIPIESLIPTATQLNETIWRTQVDLGAQKEENGEASKGFYLEINKPTQLGIKAGEYQAELTFSVENSAFTTTPTP